MECSFFFFSICCLITIGQLYALRVLLSSGVAFQPAHRIVSLKNLATASKSSSVLRGIFKDSPSLMRCLKSSQFVCLLLQTGSFSWFSASAVGVIKIRE
jgi:hypothetical protein